MKTTPLLALAGVILALALYVLSIGPAMATISRPYGLSAPAAGVIYHPILRACTHVPPLRPLLNQYVQFWYELL